MKILPFILTVFFCHGIGADNPVFYMQLIRHLVSWGYAVLYSPYSKTVCLGNGSLQKDVSGSVAALVNLFSKGMHGNGPRYRRGE